MDIAKTLVISYFLFCSLPFSISAIPAYIVVNKQPQEYCDHNDVMNLNVAKYLLGYSIIHTIIPCCYLLMHFFMATMKPHNKFRRISMSIVLIISIFSMLAAIAWFLVGSIIIFRSNIDCILDKSALVIFAICTLGISILNVLLSCIYKNW